ncbi:helix-turn-helix domain-containing protein [Solwaraspora sp. WMMB335]|uniref:helix-turn-helix domain-containing protein n=1 Tax=Solwaraspora sp. WMMB335 TaxID=3404118 RepID=UPI003B937538
MLKESTLGRPERQINGDAGPVQAFAAELRALREAAGRPKYAALARRTGRSQTALSEAAGGRRFPTWETVAAFVSGCDGDLDAWRSRWERVAAAVAGTDELVTTPAHPTGGRTTAHDSAPAVDVVASDADIARPRRSGSTRRRRGRTLSWIATAAATGLAALAGTVHAVTDTRSPDLPDAFPGPSPMSAIADGADPKDSGCAEDPDVQTVDAVEVNLQRQALGRIELRYSPRCGVSWPRFLPYTAERIPFGTPVHVDVHRPTDGATASFRADFAGTGIFGNLLHSAKDCVRAEVRIEMPEDPDAVATQTACLRGRVREAG